MSGRFYIDPAVSSVNASAAVLGGDEAHHFCRVMRGSVGDEITLFDGTGIQYQGQVTEVHKQSVSIRILETLADTIESPLRLTVATALPKGDRQRFLTEKLAELGVARLVPLCLERSVAKDASIDRLRRYVIEAAKQCGRNVLMEIAQEMTLNQYIALLEQEGGFTKLILHPAALGEAGQITPKQLLSETLLGRVAVLIGPEGSFTDAEVRASRQSGFTALDLGARILRTETACIAAASLLLTYAG